MCSRFCLQGYPQFVLPDCTDYWDGTEIWVMEPSRRESVVEVSRQWQQEGMVVHAFSYNPINVKESDIFDMIDTRLGEYEGELASLSRMLDQNLVRVAGGGKHTGGGFQSPKKPAIGLSVDKTSIFLLSQLVNTRVRYNYDHMCSYLM